MAYVFGRFVWALGPEEGKPGLRVAPPSHLAGPGGEHDRAKLTWCREHANGTAPGRPRSSPPPPDGNAVGGNISGHPDTPATTGRVPGLTPPLIRPGEACGGAPRSILASGLR